MGVADPAWAELPIHPPLCEFAHGRRVPCDAESVSPVRYVRIRRRRKHASRYRCARGRSGSPSSRAAAVPPSRMRYCVTASPRFPRSGCFRAGVALAVALGVVVRAYHVLSHEFPLNDGGLFFAMVRDLQAAHYRLPAFTSYNDAGIPFGYSPLGFYLAGLLDDWTPLTLVDEFRWVPLVSSCLILVVFANLARTLLTSRTAAVAAIFAFALVPRSYIWILMGGGADPLARLSLRVAHASGCSTPSTPTGRWRWVPLRLRSPPHLRSMSHLGTAPFVAFSGILLLLVAYGRHRRAVLGSCCRRGRRAAPQRSVVAHRPPQLHGIRAFPRGGCHRRHHLPRARASATPSPRSRSSVSAPPSRCSRLIGMLGALGFFYSLAMRDWLLPAWWIAIVTLDARQGSTFSTVPIALAGRSSGSARAPACAPSPAAHHPPPFAGPRWLVAVRSCSAPCCSSPP